MMRQRGARMSKMQQEVYIKFCEQNPMFTAGGVTSSYDMAAREKDLERLTVQLNATPGAVKNRKQWQETLADWRSKLLKRYRYHYSEEVRRSMSYKSVKNLKRFDEFDVRALKAIGKWENDHGGASKILNNTKRKLRRNIRTSGYQEGDSDDDEDDDDEDESEDNDFYHTTNDSFSFPNVKTEVDYEDPLVEEIPAPITVIQTLEEEEAPVVNRRKRRREMDVNETQYEEPVQNENHEAMSYEKVLVENTRAMKQHTAAIVGLTEALHTLTSTIRTYMYNK